LYNVHTCARVLLTTTAVQLHSILYCTFLRMLVYLSPVHHGTSPTQSDVENTFALTRVPTKLLPNTLVDLVVGIVSCEMMLPMPGFASIPIANSAGSCV